MGLDIFVYKTKLRGDNLVEIHKQDRLNLYDDFKNKFYHRFNILKNHEYDTEKYNNNYSKLVKIAKKYFKYEFYYKDLTDKLMKVTDIENWFNKQEISITIPTEIYFRKNWFVYEFYKNNNKINDCDYHWLTNDNIKDIIDECDELIHNGDSCSCWYDGYCYNTDDVKQAKKSFSYLLKHLKEGEKAYIHFSY